MRRQGPRVWVTRPRASYAGAGPAVAGACDPSRGAPSAAIVKCAGTARLKFYGLLDSQQDWFLATYDAGLEQVSGQVGKALEGAGESVVDRLTAGIGALLEFFDERPDLARAAVLEAPSLGPEMGDRREATLATFTPLFVGVRRRVKKARLLANLEESVLDGLYWLLYDVILCGNPKRPTRLRPAQVEFALMPFAGPSSAAQDSAT